jgi:hypothetical protein
MNKPYIEPLQAVIQSHKKTVQDRQASNRQKVYTLILWAVLLAEFILIRLLGA